MFVSYPSQWSFLGGETVSPTLVCGGRRGLNCGGPPTRLFPLSSRPRPERGSHIAGAGLWDLGPGTPSTAELLTALVGGRGASAGFLLGLGSQQTMFSVPTQRGHLGSGILLSL